MATDVCLLDTPKKSSLQAQADSLRVTLKDFEKSFSASHDGCKPSKEDIKANMNIAASYKQYQKLGQVLTGKLTLAALEDKSPKKRKSHTISDSVVASSPKRRRSDYTPTTRRLRPDDVDPYDPPSSATPKPLATAIGPTPQRDGKVLGIFDLLSNPPTRRSTETPRQKKQKLDMLDDTHEQPEKENALVAQTPSQRPSKQAGDLLDHLAGTPITTRLKHSRTPVSDGKKFMLSQFFATPSAVRYASLMHHSDTTPEKPQVSATPLRDRILGLTPPQTSPIQEPDATPAYLKRSHSFKDRLLSASQSSAAQTRNINPDQTFTSPVAARTGPRTMKKSKFMPKPLTQIAAEMRKQEDERYNDDEDAMREIEEEEVGVLVDNSQTSEHEEPREPTADGPRKAWKKKGQKRSTRRAIIRPSNIRTKDKPDAAQKDFDDDGDHEDDSSEEPSRVEETRLLDQPSMEEMSDDELLALMGSDFEDPSDQDDAKPPAKKPAVKKTKSMPKNNRKNPSKSTVPIQDRVLGDSPKSRARPKSRSKSKTNKGEPKEEWEEVVGKINPNAASHTNFRSLKIRNKNSKGKGRFGKGRR